MNWQGYADILSDTIRLYWYLRIQLSKWLLVFKKHKGSQTWLKPFRPIVFIDRFLNTAYPNWPIIFDCKENRI